jgi:hypothetical protein
MTVTLYAVDGQALAFNTVGTADASGKVRFDRVAYKAGRTYALATVQGTVQYHSDLVPPKDGEKTLTLPVQIYDTTTETSGVRVDEMYVVGQFLSDKELQVVNAFILSNEGDHTVEGGETTANGQRATLRFYLPAGAGNVEFEGDDGKKFSRTEDGYVTNWGIPPGRNVAQVAVRYTLPYSGRLHLETRAPYPVQKVSVLMADQGITLTSSALVDQGTQSGQDGIARRVYSGAALAAGQLLAFDLNGTLKVVAPTTAQGSTSSAAAPATSTPEVGPDDRRLLGAGIMAVGLLVLLAATIWHVVSRRSRTVDALGEHRALFLALADLDEDHERGKIGAADYNDQRAFLKAALLAARQNPTMAPEAAAEGPG